MTNKLICFEKKPRSMGFSIMEMSIVLTIIAITSVTGMRVLNSQIQQNAVDKAVSDLTIIAEVAYACYVFNAPISTCRNGEDWGAATTPQLPSTYLGDHLPIATIFGDILPPPALPSTSSSPYAIRTTLGFTGKLELNIIAELLNNKLAKRVAGSFGLLAIPIPILDTMTTTVTVKLGTPGTEQAFRVREMRIKSEIKAGIEDDDLPFDVNKITVKQIVISDPTASSSAVTLTPETLTNDDITKMKALLNLCGSGFVVATLTGSVTGGSVTPGFVKCSL